MHFVYNYLEQTHPSPWFEENALVSTKPPPKTFSLTHLISEKITAYYRVLHNCRSSRCVYACKPKRRPAVGIEKYPSKHIQTNGVKNRPEAELPNPNKQPTDLFLCGRREGRQTWQKHPRGHPQRVFNVTRSSARDKKHYG